MTTNLEQQLRRLRQGDHICLIYENAAEQLTVVAPFIIDGLGRGERCLDIADDRTREEVVQALAAAGVDVAQERQRGALRFLAPPDTYLRGGEFNPQAMIDFIRQAETEALADGFSGLRLTGEMSWSLGPEPGFCRLMDYEAILNPLSTISKSVILCQYHQSRFDATCIHHVLRTHPAAILGNQVFANPYYEPPELVLSPGQLASDEFKRKQVAWWIAELKRTRSAEQERERANIAQRESERRLREIVDLIPVAVYVCDKNGSIQQFNSRAVELWGREPRADEDIRFCGAIQHLRLDGSVIPREELPIVETIRNGTPVRNKELVIKRADGSRLVVMVNIAPIRNAEGAPVGAINCNLDVTERHQAEERLRQSERRLAEAEQVGRIGSWERDLRTNQVTWSNELYRLFDVKSAEIDLSYEQFLNRLVPQDVERTRALVDEAIRERRPFSCDYRITHADGSVHVLHDRGGLILSEEGEPIRLVGTVQDVTELRRAEQALQEYTARLQTLSHRLLEVQESERRHLALELHDEIGQRLTGLLLLLNSKGDVSTDPASTARFEQAREVVAELLKCIRGLSFDLRPAVLDQLGLLPALLALFERYTDQTGIRVSFKQQGLDERFAPDVETTAYRIVQEALTNSARHASVTGLNVRAWSSADVLSLQIEDRGRGFDPEAALANSRTSGLTGMQERVALLGGEIAIESSPGEGTNISAELPLSSQPRSLER